MQTRLFILRVMVAALFVAFVISFFGYFNYRNESERLAVNIKGILSQYDSLKDETIALNYTISELKNSEQSLYDSIKAMAKNNGIKIKTIEKIVYRDAGFVKRDTIYISGLESCVIDTCIGDEWYKLCINGDAGYFQTEVSAKSELYIVWYGKKETIYPKRIWPLCLFQRKHTVIHVNADEKNPYINTNNMKVIELEK